MTKAKIYYIMDPMCSWCWGFSETLTTFQNELGNSVIWNYIMGGLAPDSDQAMPPDMQDSIQGHWRAVAERTGATFNFDFWSKCTPRRSTYPACRAVIAAGLQADTYKPAMIQAIQKAYYLEAQNPSDIDTLVDCATSIELNKHQFLNDIQSTVVEELFQEDLLQCREWGISGFPCLVYQHDDKIHMLSNGFANLNSLTQRWDTLQF